MSRVFVAALFVCLMVVPATAGAERRFAPGQRLVDVQSESAPNQRFTVYVSKNLDRSRPVPILYLLDPRRRAEG